MFLTTCAQEAVKACLLNKYPDRSVELAVAASPDLAIVQGAAHYVQVEQKASQKAPPPGGSLRQYPEAPRYKSITAPTSYGILIAEVGQADLACVNLVGIVVVKSVPAAVFSPSRCELQ